MCFNLHVPESPRDLRAVLYELQGMLETGLERSQEWLASPEGQRFRRRAAAALIVSAPLVLRSRVLRSTPLGKLVELAGGTALVVKLAEAIRDWERGGTEGIDGEIAE